MSEIIVTAQKREISTKSVNTKLRLNGNVPGIYYTKGSEPIPVFVPESSLKPIVYTSESHIVNLQIGDSQSLKSILKNVQFDPVSDRIIHFDFQGISADQELEMDIPIIFNGQARGVREGGILQQTLHKLSVACLPADIPGHITIDISDLGFGKSIHVKDIKLDNVKILHPDDLIIVAVITPRAVAETTAEGEPKVEPEVITKGKKTEGEG